MRKLFLASLMLGTLLLLAGGPAGARVDTGAETTYVVVFNAPSGLPTNADALVARAGGTVNARLPQIGVMQVRSSQPGFAAALRANGAVRAVDEEARVSLPDLDVLADEPVAGDHVDGGRPSPPGRDPQPGSEPLYPQQWDKMRLNASASGSYAIQPGRREVVVAVLDTGAEVLPLPHPDIAPNLDYARSRAFVSPAGAALPAPDPNPAMWDDRHGHGSWCLSAVGAPINGIGISGVAPNVTLVALKVLGDTGSGDFFALANALVYSGDQKFDIASMSLSGILRHAQGGNALWIVMQRAIQYARANGVLPMAAAGNANWNLADGAFFRDFVVSPAEHAGVVTVSATGYYDRKSFYSSYGVGVIDVTAPGGATRFQNPPPPYEPLGRLLGAWSAENVGALAPVQREEQCVATTCHYYAYIQGTSMATPNAAGVAALIVSQYGDLDRPNPRHGNMPPQKVEQILQVSANNMPCEERDVFYPDIPGFALFRPQEATCQGNAGYNGFYGKGMVDAVKAVTMHGSR